MVDMHTTGANKASGQLIMLQLDARKTDGHQTHSVKVFSWGIFIDMWFLAFSKLLYRSVNVLINIDLYHRPFYTGPDIL